MLKTAWVYLSLKCLAGHSHKVRIKTQLFNGVINCILEYTVNNLPHKLAHVALKNRNR